MTPATVTPKARRAKRRTSSDLLPREGKQVAALLNVVDDRSYEKALQTLEQIDFSGSKSLKGFADALAESVRKYEEEQFPLEVSEPADVLRFLMDQHDLKQKDLTDIAPQGRISDLLRGKRSFTVAQAKALGERFGTNPVVFLDL